MNTITWSLMQYDDSGTVRTGILVEDSAFRAPAEIEALSVMDLIGDWSRWSEVLRDLPLDALVPLTTPLLVAPLTYPGKVICAGANYYDHADEMGTDRPDPASEPFFFLKTPSNTVVGPHTIVAIADDGRSQVDWEAELGVVIGRECSSIDPVDARDVIAGYVVANDLSDRGIFRRHESVFPAFDWDWVGHKSQDGFCPLGPGVVPSWLIPDPQALKIRLDVNGVVKQDSNTSHMVVDVNRLVAAASRLMTLEPGDVILTGTPAGVGMPRQDFLSPGDVVTVEIEGIGRLSNELTRK